MKKLLFFILMSLNILALGVNVSASVQTARYATTSNTIDLISGNVTTQSYVSPIYVINLELVQEFDYGDIGIGASYEQGYQRQNNEESFNAVPIYGIGKFKMGPLFLNAKYGTTLYVNVSNNATYTNAQYLQMGLGLRADNNITIEGTINANIAERNGVDVGTVTYGLTAGANVNSFF